MRLWPLLSVLAAVPAYAGPTQTFTSGSTRVSLIELYTSEGCSSCPPADRWLAGLRSDPRLWHDFIPIEFHVNYWNNLGWTDRLSTVAYTRREYAYSAEWGSSQVYTPCFVLNGAEWHASAEALGGKPVPAGELTLTSGSGAPAAFRETDPKDVRSGGGAASTAYTVHYTPLPSASATRLTAHVALLGGGLSSKVTAGENSGATLEHEFVVLSLAEGPLDTPLTLPAPLVAPPARTAIVAWVNASPSAAPLQATGGWLSP